MEKSTLLRFSDFVKDFDYDYLSPEKAWEDLENAYTSYLDTLEQTTSEKTRESIYDLRQNWTSTKKRTQNNFFNYCLQMREKHAE
ncbi:1535_t:CDS:2, partial [Funneliformis caledonium]